MTQNWTLIVEYNWIFFQFYLLIYIYIYILLFKGLSLFEIFNLDTQNTFKFIRLYGLNHRVRHVKLVI